MKTIEGYGNEMSPLTEKKLDPVTGGGIVWDGDDMRLEPGNPSEEYGTLNPVEGRCSLKSSDSKQPCPFSSCVRSTFNCSGCSRRYV